MSKLKSSLNSDGFRKKNWLKFVNKYETILRNIVESIFKISYLPECMRILGGGFVPKKDSNKVRMVKSPNYLFKVVDKIISYRLMDLCDDFILEDSQFAFIKSGNREDLVMKMTFSIDWNTTQLLLLDVSSAFDKISLENLLEKISQKDLPLGRLLSSFCGNRWIKTYFEKSNHYFKENSGTPQGSSSGPLLYILAMDEQIRKLRKRGIQISAYADDLVVITELKDDAEAIIQDINQHLTSVSLELNREKSEIYKGKFNKLHFIGYHFFIPFRKTHIQNVTREIKSKLSSSFRCPQLTLALLPVKIKKLILSNIIYPKLRSIGYTVFLNEKKHFMDTFRILNSTISLNELQPSAGSISWCWYGISHILEILWMESWMYWNDFGGNINPIYILNQTRKLKTVTRKEKKKLLARFVEVTTPMSLEYFYKEEDIYIGVGPFNVNAYKSQRMGKWDNYITMIYSQLKFVQQENIEMVVIVPRSMELTIDSKSDYKKDAFSIMHQFKDIKWTWTYGDYIKYTFTPIRITQIEKDWTTTKNWITENKINIRNTLVKWLAEENDVISKIFPNHECIIDSFGFIGNFSYRKITKFLSEVNLRMNKFKCCEDKDHHPFTCREVLEAAARDLDITESFPQNFKLNNNNIKAYQKILEYISATSEELRNSCLLFI
ncbi:uncharacterized protein LOC128387367 [Panonychus citri]|uniref:uncharacterized protein LOC128387367 n=1 Tax=Panonychus citri TaxID=50023 RepID=UPI0023078E7C|nr:uncharacterized protein LOC128387367 [Panonychus citri]XP_053202535.1 uncharacterized protein LOC128387367 [Panonychus citri]